jgi:hypothetical protein
MLAASALIALTLLGILYDVGIKFITQLAIPGGTSAIAGLMIFNAASFILGHRKLLPRMLEELAE